MSQTARVSFVPVPDFQEDVVRARRVIDQNFARLADIINRAIAGGGLVGSGVLLGDVSGPLGANVIGPLKVTDAKVAAANKDGLAATPSMRTLGSGAQQAMAGNATPTPAAHAPSHKSGGSDSIKLNELANPTASVQFSQQQVLQLRVENRTSDPGTPAVGELWLRTDL